MERPQHTIEAALDQLAAAVEAEDHPADMALWTTAAVASRFGVTFALSHDSTPLHALREVGDEWVEQIVEFIDDYPDQQADTLRVALSVVQVLVDAVRQRGLASGPTSPRCPPTGRRERLLRMEQSRVLLGPRRRGGASPRPTAPASGRQWRRAEIACSKRRRTAPPPQ